MVNMAILIVWVKVIHAMMQQQIPNIGLMPIHQHGYCMREPMVLFRPEACPRLNLPKSPPLAGQRYPWFQGELLPTLYGCETWIIKKFKPGSGTIPKIAIYGCLSHPNMVGSLLGVP